ncbi:hypothetical protein VTO42DRAFT_8339 [Malbranchea cinnamomea]
MSSPAHREFTPGIGGGDAAQGDDESGLSPESRRVLEQCAVSIAPRSSREAPTPALILRPSNSGLDMAGFHFAKPALQMPKLNSCPQPRLPEAKGATESQSEHPPSTANNSQTTIQSLNMVDAPEVPPQRSHREKISPTSTAPHELPAHYGSQSATASSSFATRPSTECPAADTEAGTSENRTHCPAASIGSAKLRSHPLMQLSGVPCEDSVPEIPEPNGRQSHTPPSQARSPSIQAPEQRSRHHTPESNKGFTGKLKSVCASPTSRVTKPRPLSGKSTNKIPTNNSVTAAFTFQPSEEDLFYMLIHRLKRRDEAEAASAALREQLQERLNKIGEENRALTAQVKQAMILSNKQQAELASQRSLIERWKAKFGKLRSLIKVIGDDQESLRVEGQRLKMTQHSLHEEKDRVFEQLKAISSATETVEQKWSNRKQQLGDIRHDAAALEHKHIRQGETLERKREETMSKIDDIYKQIDSCSRDCFAALTKEFNPLVDACAELLKKVNEKGATNSDQLNQTKGLITELKRQLTAQCEIVTKNFERLCVDQKDSKEEMVSKLRDLQQAIDSTSTVVNQLAEARELIGRLQEKLSSAESSLALSNADRDDLREREMLLKERIRSLESDMVELKKELETQSHGTMNVTSEMQIQLEVVSCALAKATENLRAKDAQLQSLEAELTSTRMSLENSEVLVATLQTEKAKLEEDARKIEQKVREELARASLKSKDQSRALFEQEQHRLMREKASAEREVQKVKEQLERTKRSIEDASKTREELSIMMTKLRGEVEEMKIEKLREAAEMGAKIAALEEEKGLWSKEREDMLTQISRSRTENEQLRSELSRTQSAVSSDNQMDLLQERFDFLQRECMEKDEQITVLKEQMEKAQEGKKQAAELEQTVAERCAQVEALKTQVKEIQQASVEATERLQEKDKSILLLTERVKSLEHHNEKNAVLKETLRSREEDLDRLECRLHEAEFWPAKIQGLLGDLGLVGPEESLGRCWDSAEKKLRNIVSQVRLIQTPRVKGKPSPPSGARKRQTMDQHEYQTTEIVYRQHRIQGNMSASPKRTAAGSGRNGEKEQKRPAARSDIDIRPFSQVQWDPSIVGLSSPLSQLTDLSSVFPASPDKVTENQARPAQKETVNKKARSLPLPPKETARLQCSQQSLHQGAGPKLLFPTANNVAELAGTPEHPHPLGDLNINISGALSAQKRKAADCVVDDEPMKGDKKDSADPQLIAKEKRNNGLSQDRSQSSTQNQNRKTRPRGILKDSSIPSPSRSGLSALHTPMKEKRIGRASVQRPPSSTSLSYFDIPVSPITTRSGISLGSKRSSQAMDPSAENGGFQTRFKTRRKTKGNRYSERFSQESQKL